MKFPRIAQCPFILPGITSTTLKTAKYYSEQNVRITHVETHSRSRLRNSTKYNLRGHAESAQNPLINRNHRLIKTLCLTPHLPRSSKNHLTRAVPRPTSRRPAILQNTQTPESANYSANFAPPPESAAARLIRKLHFERVAPGEKKKGARGTMRKHQTPPESAGRAWPLFALYTFAGARV